MSLEIPIWKYILSVDSMTSAKEKRASVPLSVVHYTLILVLLLESLSLRSRQYPCPQFVSQPLASDLI